MPLLILFMVLFILLAFIWIIGAGALLTTLFSNSARGLGSVLDYKGKKCACHFPFRHNE
jgi:hypothetical protein